ESARPEGRQLDLLAVALDREANVGFLIARDRGVSQNKRDAPGVFDLLVVHLDDDVAGLQTTLFGGGAGLDVGDAGGAVIGKDEEAGVGLVAVLDQLAGRRRPQRVADRRTATLAGDLTIAATVEQAADSAKDQSQGDRRSDNVRHAQDG